MSFTRLAPSLVRARILATAQLHLEAHTTTQARLARRHYASESDAATKEQSASQATPLPITDHEGWLFVDSIFPIRIGSFDLRHYIALLSVERIVNQIKTTFSDVKTASFTVLELEPRMKDGGLFVHFKYKATAEDVPNVLRTIENDLQTVVQKSGGLPSWLGVKRGRCWIVKGRPWREDMNRYASPMLRVAFEGPDLQEEDLYDIMRKYGRITELTPPQPGANGAPRFSLVNYGRLRAATRAHNVLHAASVPVGSDPSMTRLRTVYERPIKAHAIRDWISAHPRIVLPILFFLLGTLTYTIFDPIRVFAVEAKMLGWLDYRDYKVFQWLRTNTLNTLEMFSLAKRRTDGSTDMSMDDTWKERRDAEDSLRNYMSDLPTTIAFVHGPQGSGKTRMLHKVLDDSDRKVMVIDCEILYKASSDTVLVSSLASMVGYWPAFPFVNSLNSMIDLASMGLIGQKAGLSSSLESQLKQILEVTGTGLQGVINSTRKSAARRAKKVAKEEAQKWKSAKDELPPSQPQQLRDGRSDAANGDGVVSELEGGGDSEKGWVDVATENITGLPGKIGGLFGMGKGEESGAETNTGERQSATSGSAEGMESDRRYPVRSRENLEAVGALPVIVIKSYATKGTREELLSVLAEWSATLVSNQIAHVIVVSDNRENSKRLAQALPSKPITSVPLYDADAATALSFVRQRLHDANISDDLSGEQVSYIERLGGRSVDLESLVHKVRSGQSIQEAVEDIVNRGVSELRKNAFGDDVEDAKTLPWTREQAWAVLYRLSKQEEIPYHDVLVEFPFKGDETALKKMEHAELITIGTVGGRPSVIRPGKPVYHYVFERLVSDPIFKAVQEIAYNDKIISSAESTIKTCEDELLTLDKVERLQSRSWFGGHSTLGGRVEYLLKKMDEATTKVEKYERRNSELKKVLAGGG